jgi:hypothetical protein
MTKVFDDNARKQYEQQTTLFNELEYNGVKVKDMVVKEVDVSFARPYIAKYHYSKTMPDSTVYVYAGFYNEKLAGIVCYGMGTGLNQYKYVIPNIEKGQYVELTRLWSPDEMPKNTESKLISQSIKMLPKDIKLILSYADDSKNHKGYVYQATNFYYLGINNGGKMLVTKDGIEKHPRLLGIYKMRHPEYKKYSNDELMNLLEYRYKTGGKKHRYVYIRGCKKTKKKMYKQFESKLKQYPKLEVNNVNQ